MPKNLTELDRLSYTVRAIEIECQIVPIGGFRMCEQHEMRYNDSFRGLSAKNLSLKNFQHFRYPQTESAIKKMGIYESNVESSNCIFLLDFLEGLQNEDHWSLQLDTTQEWVTVRSLFWQGYVAFHHLGTQDFGGVYVGNGVKSPEMALYL